MIARFCRDCHVFLCGISKCGLHSGIPKTSHRCRHRYAETRRCTSAVPVFLQFFTDNFTIKIRSVCLEEPAHLARGKMPVPTEIRLVASNLGVHTAFHGRRRKRIRVTLQFFRSCFVLSWRFMRLSNRPEDGYFKQCRSQFLGFHLLRLFSLLGCNPSACRPVAVRAQKTLRI